LTLLESLLPRDSLLNQTTILTFRNSFGHLNTQQPDIWLEAECGEVGSNWSLASSNAASKGQYLLPPSGNSYNTPPVNTEDMVRFIFELDQGGTYRIFARVDAPTSDDDSFWLRVNNRNWIKWNEIDASNFAWDEVHDSDAANMPISFNLLAGNNIIEIGWREDGIGLDKVLITKNNTLPTALGDSASNCIPSQGSPILLSPIPDQGNFEGDNVSLQAQATGGDGALVYAANNLPPGLSINANSGLISGSISSTAAGNSPYSVRISIDDSDGDNTDIEEDNFIWVVNPRTQIFLMSIPDQNYFEGDNVSLQVQASGGDGALTYFANNFPPGLSINANTGLISGTLSSNAADNSTYISSVSVDDSDGDISDIESRGFSWNISPRTTINLSTISNQNDFEGDNVNLQVQASGGDGALVYAANNLPPGLSINTNSGQISGSLSANAANNSPYSVTISVDDSDVDNSDIQNENFIWVVNPRTAITLNPIANQSDFEGDNVNLQVQASGGDGALIFSANNLPPGLSINTNSGQISGSLSANAANNSPYSVTISVDDSDADNSDIQNESFSWVVNPRTAINLNPIPDQNDTESNNISLQIQASGGDGALVYTANNLPPGLNINANSGQISGTLSNGSANNSPYAVSISVDDSDGDNSDIQSENFSWIISPNNPGGINDNWIILEPQISPKHIPRHENSFVQAGDKFYLFGGRESPKVVESYNYVNKSWSSSHAQAPQSFNHFQPITYQGLIWVIGAFKANGFPTEPNAERVYMYDPLNDNWINGANIPTNRRRGSAALVMYNDKFYVIGGNNNGHSGGYVAWFDEFDPATNTWTQLTDAPRARDHFQAVLIGNKIYCAGGRQTGGSGGLLEPRLAEVDVYDFSSNSWSTLPASSNLPTLRAGTSSVNFKGQLVVIGGEGGGMAFDDVEAFDPSNNSWTTLASMNFARHGTGAIVSGDGIYTTSGSPVQGGGRMTNMEVYNQDNATASSNFGNIITSSSLHYEMNYGRQSVSLIAANGNQAKYIKSISIQGKDKELVNLHSDRLNDFLLHANSTQELQLAVLEKNSSELDAYISVTYDEGQKLEIPILADQFDDIKVYPNPIKSSESLIIEFLGTIPESFNYSLFDARGRKIQHQENRYMLSRGSAKAQLSLEALPEGIYVLLIEQNGKRKIQRIEVN
ncbi:MAG: putative Ig domain-containing protein, partial [Bacteroidota bacterium]